MKKVLIRIMSYGLLAITISLSGCRPQEPTAVTPVNYFSMQVNGQSWTPYQSLTDPCNSTYDAQHGMLNNRDGSQWPFYQFAAYRDPKGRADAFSENMLRIQMINVDKPGDYVLRGTWKASFQSCTTFSVKQSDETYIRYINSPSRQPFVVRVADIAEGPLIGFPSIRGTFAGVLYNEVNAADSLIIGEGKFYFKYMSGYNCGY